MNKFKIISIISAIVIVSLVVTFFLTRDTQKAENKGKVLSGLEYQKWQLLDVFPENNSISENGAYSRFYDFQRSRLKLFDIEKSKTVWESKVLGKIKKVSWNPVNPQALVLMDNAKTDQWQLISPTKNQTLQMDNADNVGWWSKDKIFYLKFNEESSKTEVISLNPASGISLVELVIDDYLTDFWPAPDHQYFVYTKPGEGDAKGRTYLIKRNGGTNIEPVHEWIGDATGVVWSPKEDKLALVTSEDNHTIGEIINSKGERVGEQFSIDSSGKLAWADNNFLLIAKTEENLDGNEGNNLYVYDLTNGTKKNLLQSGELFSVEALRFH
jgi:hypothetical protein